ncbi:MAG: 4a-hydroxytetrahydrobiopterin dehydratase [Burkholderiales bacterium]|nr:MAG: 4a-hydroxytetrahydrobiopterin dehydratase [Burkholderiales bacterium]
MKQVIGREQLATRNCKPLEDQRGYSDAEIEAQLAELPGWKYHDGFIERSFAFRDYYETIAFVNALAWIVHGQDHHPDLHVGYNRCLVRWNTHSVDGISENDFICAARTDAVFGRAA